MSSIRIFILGTLAREGPMHGHRIRHSAQRDHTEVWTDIKVGSLYAALKRLAGEGLIREVRTEQEGNRPERTVYEITQQGRGALATLLGSALMDARFRPDPIDLALSLAGDFPPGQLRRFVLGRRLGFQAQLDSMRALMERAGPHLSPLERLGFDHQLMRLETEVRWHDMLIETLSGQGEQEGTP